MIRLTINDQLIEAREGQTVLEAARANQITIPTLCYHKDLSPAGSCRLCVVEVDKIRGQVAACTQIVNEGMVAHTETPAIIQSRKMILQLLLANYHDAGYATAQDPALNELMYWVKRYAVQPPRGLVSQPHYTVNSDPNPFVWVDWNKCILCTRCIRACAEVQGRFVWGVAQRGFDAKIVAGADTNMIEARCESCGACVVYCPTGALDHKLSMNLGQPDRVITTTCTYCGVGCQIDLNIKDNRIIRVTSNATAAVNGLAMCVKGRYGYDFVHHPDRLTKPRVRKYLLEGSGIRDQGSGNPQSAIRNQQFDRGEWIDVDWDTALNIVAKKFVEIKKQSGPDSIGVLASAKCTNEENYLMQKFARQVIGTHNVDHCARLCHSSTVAGLAMCYGSGAMSNTMEDIADNAQAIFIIGSNTTEQHPVFGAKIRQAVLQRGVKLIVADPRKIDITEFATLHIRQKPGTDVALINGLMHIIFKNNWHDQKYIDERCENFEEFRSTIEKYPPELVSEITGVSIEQLQQAAELISINKPMAVFWAMGITQHTTGVFNVLSLGNLQMLLGNMGVPGGGVNPLRGQNNVQGACDMGALPNVFPGYQAVTDEKVRQKFSDAWALLNKSEASQRMKDENFIPHPSSFIPSNRPGLTVTEMIPQAGEGKVRALYILGEDPMLTDPDLNHVRECLEACEFTVLQEIFPSVTSEYADVLLPGASFAEKDGTFTNTERHVQLIRQAINPIGESKPDWLITAQLAQRMIELETRTPIGPQAAWDYHSPSEIMDEITVVTPSYAGVNYDRLQRGEQLHWPVKDPNHPGTPILHIGQFTRGKGKFHAIDHLPAKELPDAEYPIVLTTGRVIYHWHGGEMTRRAQGLLEIYPESLIEINPEDALKIGLNDQRTVKVTSRRGEMIAEAIITDRVSPGLIFGNFHFPGAQNVNNVTIAALDPIAKIPEYKVCAVKVERVQK